jgi:hypothetical protein
MEKLIKEWEALAAKYDKQARDSVYNDLLAEKLYAMAEVYSYCADCLRRLKNE